ncbi:MAG: low specificity L-threonine aldolase [bacterium]|nr:low specificity L-threonine aldolase [bacterium]
MARLRGFASDNNAGVHPDILKAIEEANVGHAIGYGGDPWTKQAKRKFQEHFGNVDVFFVFAGTSANVLCLQAMTDSFNEIICSAVAHINVDECGAPEKFTGCKLLPIPSPAGKITVEQIRQQIHGAGDEHHVQPKVISITQATEYGTLYSVEEIRAITDYAHANGMLVHMDGARIANAASSLGVGLDDITGKAGIDALSFGGTKNGMMYGEAVVLFNKSLAANFKYIRKQSMQLASKMRFISTQFTALLSNDLWRKNAAHANQMAKYLAQHLRAISWVQISQKVQANAVFAILPEAIIPRLQKEYFFYVWNEERGEIRLMTSFDTTVEDLEFFAAFLQRTVR